MVAACDDRAHDRDGRARSCTGADEGARLFAKYERVLSLAADWEKVGWIRQVAISKWIACQHGIAHHAPIDDCLDRLGYDVGNAALPFAAALDQCVRAAKPKPRG